MSPRRLLPLLAGALAACAGAPAPLPPRTVADPDALATALLGGRRLEPHQRLRVQLEPGGGLSETERARWVARLEAALAERVGQEAVARGEALPGERWAATHLTRGVVEARPPHVRWQLIDLDRHVVLTTARLALDAPAAEMRLAPAEDPLALTRGVIEAARLGDGAAIARALHPELARRWEREGRAAGQDLARYAAARLGPLGSGRVLELDLDLGETRAEVEVELAGKVRDVDFQWRREAGRWLLRSVGDL